MKAMNEDMQSEKNGMRARMFLSVCFLLVSLAGFSDGGTNSLRNVRSVEAISVDTMYPGATPFPGARRLAFSIAPKFDGSVKMQLSHDTKGTAWQGVRQTFRTPVSNGVARFTVDLPYTTQYEFLSLEEDADPSQRRSFKVVKAQGEFFQTAAEAMRLTVETGNPLHLVRDETERPYLIVSNPADRDIGWQTMFVLTDYFKRRMEVPFNRVVRAGETVKVAVPWPLKAKGVWRVKAEVLADDGSRAVKETRFAYIDRHEVTEVVGKPKFRLGIHYHGTKYWPDKVDLTIAALVAAGAKLTRCDYSHMWGSIEQRPGEFCWEPSDTMIRKMREAGLSLDIIFASTPEWAMTPESIEKNKADRARGLRVKNCCAIPRPGLFRDFCVRYARRYGTAIDYYETGNEWDLTGTETVSHENLLRIQREAYEGLHEGCPDVCVIPNGWTTACTPLDANPKIWNIGLVEYFAGHSEYYDAWALHAHCDFNRFQGVIDEQFLPLRNSKPLKSRPWLLNETGLSGWHGREDLVARTIWMKVLFGWSRGARDYIWYNLRATGWFDGSEPGYGLITAGYYPRSGYAAFSALSTIFQGLDFDSTICSLKGRCHLFRFRGRSQAVDGMVLAGWSMQDTGGPIPTRIRTDARRAFLSDLMGNRTSLDLRGGIVEFPVISEPQALLLEGARIADLEDGSALLQEIQEDFVIRPADFSGEPTFKLDGPDSVRSIYEANPAMVHRLWTGNADLSAKIWLAPDSQGLKMHAVVTDDIRADGDQMEFRFSMPDGRAFVTNCPPRRREEGRDVYEEILPIRQKRFGLELRVYDDDGEGADGYLFLRKADEKPLQISVE